MIFAFISHEDRDLIEKKLKETKDVRWYRRLKIIQLSSAGKTVPQLAETFDLSFATVRDYIKRYNEGGVFELKRSYSKGRPFRIEMSKEEWEDLLRRSPCQFEKLNTAVRNWTQELLVKYCSLYRGILVAQSTISTLLKRLGIRWNRGKLKVTSPDPLYTVKRDRVESLKKKVLRES